jgi:hypothetical protein
MLAMGIYQISSGLSLYAEDFTVTSIEPWFWLYVGLFAFFLISLKVWIMMEEHKARQNVGMLSSDHMMDQASEVPSYEIDRDHDDLMLAPTAQFVPTK